MPTKLSQQEIGARISSLRKNKGLSQNELAKRVGLSRSSLTQIELGGRKMSVLELHKFSIELMFSIDSFLSDNFNLLDNDLKIEIVSEEKKARVSIPEFNIGKFKNILLYILEHCAGKPNVGETLLYKLLYFSDFNYYELYEEQLTGATYRKLQYGPVPQKLDLIIKQMIDDSELQRIKTEYHGYPQTRYIPLVKPDLTKLKASEKETIDRVIDQFSDWTASAISDYSHKDMPWMASKDGEDIDYELVFYREVPYSVRNYEDER